MFVGHAVLHATPCAVKVAVTLIAVTILRDACVSHAAHACHPSQVYDPHDTGYVDLEVLRKFCF